MGHEYGILGMAGVGFFGMLLIGFLAGWIAERTMNRDHGALTNILVGIAGSFVGGTAASILGFQWYGFIGNLVVATLGAIAILWFFGKKEHPVSRRGDSLSRGDRNTRDMDQPASEHPEESDSDLPPIYHASDETPAPKPKTMAKATTRKTAARKTPARKTSARKPSARKPPAKGKK